MLYVRALALILSLAKKGLLSYLLNTDTESGKVRCFSNATKTIGQIQGTASPRIKVHALIFEVAFSFRKQVHASASPRSKDAIATVAN